ncbi:MAG: protein kinase [Phycisphaerae bacterium]|nr:protein kinase [Phycisphaerae bacterium]
MTKTRGSSSGGSSSGTGLTGLIGRVVGDYRILREVGRGGMGTVYEAHQVSLDRIVALKVLSYTASVPESSIIRFRREAQAAAKLQHNHIVQIYAQGEDEGLHFYAMEFVQGRSVHQLIAESASLGGNGARDGSADSTRGSDASGTAGPTEETVLLDATPRTASGSSRGRVRARRTGRPGSTSAPQTPAEFDRIARYVSDVADALEYAHRNGVIHRDIKPHNLMIGTDSRIRVSDFGLARVLEQPGLTVTGEFLGSPLYMSPEQISRGDTLVDHRTDIYSLGATLYEWLTLAPPFPGESREQVIAQILTADMPPPREVNPHVPVDLETICLKALEKEPKRRYASAAAMRDDLNAYLHGRAIRARRAGTATRLRKLVARNPVATMALLVVAIAISLSTAYYQQRSRHQALEHRQTAKVEEQTARLEDAEQKNEELRALVEALTPAGWRLIQETVSTSEEELREPLISLSQRFARGWLADFLRAERRRLEEENPEVASDSGLEYYLSSLGALATGNVTAALAALDHSLQSTPDDPYARELRAVLRCGRQQFVPMAHDATALIESRPDHHVGYLLRGAARLFADQPQEALDDLARAGELGEDEPSAWRHTLAGTARLRAGQFDKARIEYDEALVTDPAMVSALLGRAKCLYELQDYAGAIRDTDRVIEIAPDVADAYIIRGESHDRREEFDESLADYVQASRLRKDSRSLMLKVLWAQANQKRKEEALATLQGQTPTDANDNKSSTEEDAVPPLEDDDSEWFQKFLEDRLQTEAPPNPLPHVSTRTATRTQLPPVQRETTPGPPVTSLLYRTARVLAPTLFGH